MVKAKAPLLTRIVKFDEEKQMVLISFDLLMAGVDGLLSHNGRTAWVTLNGTDWESESQRIHTRLSDILQTQLKSLFEPGFEGVNEF